MCARTLSNVYKWMLTNDLIPIGIETESMKVSHGVMLFDLYFVFFGRNFQHIHFVAVVVGANERERVSEKLTILYYIFALCDLTTFCFAPIARKSIEKCLSSLMFVRCMSRYYQSLWLIYFSLIWYRCHSIGFVADNAVKCLLFLFPSFVRFASGEFFFFSFFFVRLLLRIPIECRN